MVRLKTAVYPFECPLQAGAILAGASDAVVATLGDFGREIGIAFQLVDDLLGVFGAESLTGKTTLGDLREGKRTVLIAYATMRDGWAEFEGDFGNPDLDEAGADRIRLPMGNTPFAASTAARSIFFSKRRTGETLVDSNFH